MSGHVLLHPGDDQGIAHLVIANSGRRHAVVARGLVTRVMPDDKRALRLFTHDHPSSRAEREPNHDCAPSDEHCGGQAAFNENRPQRFP